MNFVSRNALQRTFRIQYGQATGTCFVIDILGRQYLISAAHVIPSQEHSITVQIRRDGKWEDLACKLVGVGKVADVIVLLPERRLIDTDPLEPQSDGITLSQDVFFLGFPFGLESDLGHLNNGYPIPLVKKACVSAIETVDKSIPILLDGHNNPGFSGAPVVWGYPNRGTQYVLGIVSGYRYDSNPVLTQTGQTEFFVKDNTGIISVYSIRTAMALIEINPLGALLS